MQGRCAAHHMLWPASGFCRRLSMTHQVRSSGQGRAHTGLRLHESASGILCCAQTAVLLVALEPGLP